MTRRKRWPLFWIIAPVLAVGIFFLVFVYYLIDPNLYRNVLQESLTTLLGREVTFGRARISLWEGVAVDFEDVRVKDRSSAFYILESKRVILKAKLVPLLRKEIKWKRIIIDHPTIRLVRDREGRFNFADGPLSGEDLKASQQRLLQTIATFFGGSFSLRNGEVFFRDEGMGGPPLTTEIRDFNLHLPEIAYSRPFSFRLGGKVQQPGGEAPFSMEGTLERIQEDMDLSRGKMNAKTEVKGIDITRFWPYLRALLPMKALSGSLDLSGAYEGDLSGPFKASARVRFRDPVVDYPEVFAYVFRPKFLQVDVETEYDTRELRVPRVAVEMPELAIRAKGRIYGFGTAGMGMEAEAQSNVFDLADGKRFIPYRIITKDVSEALYKAEGRGPVQILSVRLKGKMAEIDHCDLLENSHVLSVEMKLNGAGLKLPWNLPPFDDLKGHLAFEKGNLLMKEVTGRVFQTTLEKVNGSFTELLHVPTLEFRCEGKFELSDLTPFSKTDLFPDDFAEAVAPVAIQAGRGEYTLWAKGVLADPYPFQHQESFRLSRARFTHAQIPFPVAVAEGKIDLSHEELRWSGARVEFGATSFLMSGAWKHRGKARFLDATARGRVDLKNLFALGRSPLFPEAMRTQLKALDSLSGTGQLTVHARTAAGAPSAYDGEFVPREVSWPQKGLPAPLVFREGSFAFSNAGVSLSKIKVQVQDYALLVDGSVRDDKVRLTARGSLDLRYLPPLLKASFFPESVRSWAEEMQEVSGEAELRVRWQGEAAEGFKAIRDGEVKLKGFAFRHKRLPLPLSQVDGVFTLTPGQFRFGGVKGKLGESSFLGSGAVPRADVSPLPGAPSPAAAEKAPAERDRWLSFQIASPLLDLDALFPRKQGGGPASFEGAKEWLTRWEIEGKVEAEQFRSQGILLQDLKTEMKTTNGKLHLQNLQFHAAGGDVWGEGWLSPAEKGIRIELNPRLSNMDAKAFLRVLLNKGEEEKIVISGRVHVDKVELQAEGETFQAMREGLNGKLRMEISNGAIERFNVLSKIFSILNITQVFVGRLPDLKSRGLPFHRITSTIQIKDGVATTDDFLVDSDAMRITLLGKIDVGHGKIDARVGVHPLVTLDTVLSKVPIAGYILTGKDKAFITFLYEVTGDLEDPKLEAIPIKATGEGVFGIIKRLLETPIRPFQRSNKKE